MAINKKLIHFNNFSTFNSKKLSANSENTKYTLGINGAVTNGSPEILYQSICYIKDTKQQWTHGQLYDGSKSDTLLNETDPVFSASPAAAITEEDIAVWGGAADLVPGHDADIAQLFHDIEGKQDIISDLIAIREGASKGATALQSYTEQYKGTITEVSANGTRIATSGVANIPAASTSKYGVTKLSSSTSSTSTSLAATPSAVKSAYDLANGKQDKLVSGTNIKTINGQSILGSGDITINNDDGSRLYYLGNSSPTRLTEFGDAKIIGDYEVEYGYLSGGNMVNWRYLQFSEPVKSIPDAAFTSSVAAIWIPPTVTNISRRAFASNIQIVYAENYMGDLSWCLNNTSLHSSIILCGNSSICTHSYPWFWAKPYVEGALGYNAGNYKIRRAYVERANLCTWQNTPALLGLGNYTVKYINPIEASCGVYIPAVGSIIFTTGNIVPSITYLGSIKWVNGKVPELQPNKTYEMSFNQGLAVCAEY